MADDKRPTLRVIDIQEDNSLSCSEKLTTVQNIVNPRSYHAIPHVSMIIEECATVEPQLCLETAFLVASRIRGYNGALRDGLQAIADADTDIINQFITNTLDTSPIEDAFPLISLIPHLYREREDELVDQFDAWRSEHEWFWYRAVDQTLAQYDRDAGAPSKEFCGEIRTIQSELRKIAEAEGVDPDDETGANWLLEETHDLLDDIYWANVDKAQIRQNITSYPDLEEFLRVRESWLDDLTEHNEHTLARHLSHSHSESEAEHILEDDDIEPEERQRAKSTVQSIKLLEYYNSLVKEIRLGDERTRELRDRLLDRPQFEKAIAELEVICALRGEFDSVEMEPTIPGTDGNSQTDCKITSTEDPIWVEITYPDPTESAAVSNSWTTTADPQKSDVRTTVTRKGEQIIEAKEAGGLTMLVMKNEVSRFEDVEVRSYATGPDLAVVPEGGNEAMVLKGQSGPELNDDDVTDHLDILVNFNRRDVDDTSVDGQIYVLNSDKVDEEMAYQLATAFSPESQA